MANAKTAIKRLKNALDKKYEVSQPAPVAGAVGDGKLFIDGQLYNGAIAGVTQVINVGRPAAAQYAAKTGGGVIVQSGGGGSASTGGGSGPDVTALSLLTVVGEAALTSDRYLDVTTALTKTDGGAGGALTIGMATPGGLTVSSTNVATGNHTHAITSSSAPGVAASILASSAAGLLTLPNFTATTSMRTPLIDTASGNLTLQPAGTSVVDVNTLLTGGFGARASSGTLDWNDATNARPGSGHSLMRRTDSSNAPPNPPTGTYFHPFSFEYSTKTGAGNITQFAIPYANSTGIDAGIHMRGRFSGTWTNWAKLISENTSGNVLVGTYTDGGYKFDVTGTARITTSLTTPLLTASTKVTTPLIDTASGNLTLTPAGGTVAVSAALTVGTTATITGVTSIASGSVGAPGLTFTGDTNSGLYRSGVDAYSLVAGGAAIINVGATGAGVNAAFDNTAALKVQSVANDDITLFLKQKSGQTARMWRVEDSAGQELIVLDSQGNLQSGNPGFVSGLTGWQITPIGNAELNNAFIRGELHASIFVMDEFHASGGTLYIAPAGKLELDATVYTTTGIEAVFDIRTTSVSGSGSQFDIRTTSGSGSGSQFTWRTIENYFEITDPPSGHAMILSPGDIIRCKALGLSVGIDLWDVWGVVGRVEDMTDYYRYYYERKSGGANGLVIPAGTAIISYGAPGDGRIYLTADQNYAPYMQVFLSGEEPWNGQITPTVRIGRLDGVGLPGVSGIEQHGIVLSSDLSDASAPYLVASNLQMFQYKIDSEWNNGNPTARITADGEFRLGTDVDSDATTGLKFNPITGALDIGNASYPGTVNVRGVITVTGGSGIAAFTDANLDNIANGATYGRINNTIIGGGFIRVGSGNKDSTLNGWYVDAGEIVGQAAGVDQVVLDTSGKMVAGAGALQLDRTAFHVANSATSKGIQFYTTNTFTNANKAGRLWALNGTPYSMYMSAGRSTFDGDSTNAAGQIQLVGLGASGIAGASVEISGSTQIVEITASEIDAFGDLDMNGYDIIDANNCWAMRSTAAL